MGLFPMNVGGGGTVGKCITLSGYQNGFTCGITTKSFNTTTPGTNTFTYDGITLSVTTTIGWGMGSVKITSPTNAKLYDGAGNFIVNLPANTEVSTGITFPSSYFAASYVIV